jgi:hypothetical protein
MVYAITSGFKDLRLEFDALSTRETRTFEGLCHFRV